MDACDIRKATLGIMVSWRARAPSLFPSGIDGKIDPARCSVAVGSTSPGCAAAAKGGGVHPLKGYVSWVQNGVSQFGLYLLEMLLSEWKNG